MPNRALHLDKVAVVAWQNFSFVLGFVISGHPEISGQKFRDLERKCALFVHFHYDLTDGTQTLRTWGMVVNDNNMLGLEKLNLEFLSS